MNSDELRQRVLNSLQQNPLGCDLLLSALATSSAHYRRATVCRPFPDTIFTTSDTNSLQRDYSALNLIIKDIPSIKTLASSPPIGSSSLSTQQVLLLDWLYYNLRSMPCSALQPITLEQLQDEIPTSSMWRHNTHQTISMQPQLIFQVSRQQRQSSSGDDEHINNNKTAVMAFHGTSFENLHSILHLGMLNLSKTRLERNGAVFGEGIYFAESLETAFEFGQPVVNGWDNSMLGPRIRCILVCEIDKSKDAAAQSDTTSKVPKGYIVVERSDMVQIKNVLVYIDGETQQQQHRPARGWLILLAAYLMFLLWFAINKNWPVIRRFIWHQYAIKL